MVGWINNLISELYSRTLGEAHVPPTKVFRRLTGSVNKTIVKARVAACSGQYVNFRVPALIR